ncbi:Methyltransferase type 11 [Desulfosudis oleivorans Hxd3]|uniref:Methyltransferase type 11 n=2 Tax=Desulfosudis TaxID=2904716 RepID=A8ZWQ1_DESOH|nr:Methyltransferase type 11 [Desulfosudis oleivorans Hxd3]
MKNTGKNQWYDGYLYGWFFDPVETANRQMILDFVPEGSTVLDVGCGTGRLALELAAKCRHVTGVDLSRRMLAYCERQKNKRGVKNLDFAFGDSTRLAQDLDRSYDVAVTSLALHEMGPDERHATVRAMAAVADRLVISDHTVPQPATLPGFVIHLMEWSLGGRDIFPLYREYVVSGGILGALERCGLSPDRQRMDRHGIRHVVTASTRTDVLRDPLP